ncbi:DUF2470 domain-containing protein [Salinibacterium sp. SYSU T00001]|uniref:DUF2470 domain-containing protein n=1 Tax=Homoserinimonas sedimenticola TaxID=2986805 RepID=UPI0022369693|nr:DUF2470 domain-containing protein [Salinibacterium sedimenticola]MCW4386461.1 DUF2470 domain-containing protein [Salinibacterium sedimenticola]
MSIFSDDVVASITGYMNGNQPDTTLLIARVHGNAPKAESAFMRGFDEHRAVFTVTTPDGVDDVEVPWGHTLTSRDEVRTELFRLFESAVIGDGT